MSKLRLMVAVGLILPLAAFGSAVDAGAVDPSPSAAPTTDGGTGYDYRCCWVYYMGLWWCVPC